MHYSHIVAENQPATSGQHRQIGTRRQERNEKRSVNSHVRVFLAQSHSSVDKAVHTPFHLKAPGQGQPERGLGVGFGCAVLRGGAARARGPKPARSPRSGAGVADPETARDRATGSDGKDAVLTGTGGCVPPRWCWQDAPGHPGWAADAFAASLRPLSLVRSRPYRPQKFFFSLRVFILENCFHFSLPI